MTITDFKKKVFMWCVVPILVSSLYSMSTLADVVVIVNPDSGVNSLSRHKIKELFLGKTKSLSNDMLAVVVDHKEGRKIRNIFTAKVLGKSESQLKAYWSTLIFSGKGVPPKTLSSSAEIKAFVAGTSGAIGYINSDHVDSSVQAVYTLK